jgi:hypothetical protein
MFRRKCFTLADARENVCRRLPGECVAISGLLNVLEFVEFYLYHTPFSFEIKKI